MGYHVMNNSIAGLDVILYQVHSSVVERNAVQRAGVSIQLGRELTIKNNTFVDRGVSFWESDDLTIRENNFTACDGCAWALVDFRGTRNVSLEHNLLKTRILWLHDYWLGARPTSNVSLVTNTLRDGWIDVNSSGQFILSNTVDNTGYGSRALYIYDGGSRNVILRNNFIGMSPTFVVNDDGYGNSWDNGSMGNHYGLYDEPREGCSDLDEDGMCDSPYLIPGQAGSADHFPLIRRF